MATLIGIDTAHNKRYSGVIVGSDYEISRVHNEIHKLLKSHGKGGVIHWRKIPDNVRRNIKQEALHILNNSKMSLFVFEHQKQLGIRDRDYYLIRVPNGIASFLERRMKIVCGYAVIHSDDDYLVSNVEDSTGRFLWYLLDQLSFRLAGQKVPIKVKDGKLRATVKQENGKILEFLAAKSKKETSHAICVADFIIGFYLYNQNDTDVQSRIRFKKV